MRWLVLILCFIGTATLAQEDDRSFLTGLIEDAVSDLGREVRLVGFEGGLQSEARVTTITIADETGIWLRLDEVTLQWTRSALLSGRIEIDRLSAARIELLRTPESSDSGLPSAEATRFELPELPVAINIANISADQIILAPEILGEAVQAQFTGEIALAEGSGSAVFELERRDQKSGRFAFEGGFSNRTRHLSIDLVAEEGRDGIATRLLGIPGQPAARLSILGDGSLDDFVAQIALSTNGTNDLSGTVSAMRNLDNTEATGREYALNLSGDLRPLVAVPFHPFFGAHSRIALTARTGADGAFDISNLSLRTNQLSLTGQAGIGADGWPISFDITGRISSGGGTPVRLPTAQTPIDILSADLALTFDAAQDDAWSARFEIDQIDAPDISAERLRLTGAGHITPKRGTSSGQFSADLDYAAEGLTFDDTGLEKALGPALSGRAILSRQEGEPLDLEQLTLTGEGLNASLSASVRGLQDRFATGYSARIDAMDLSRFAELLAVDIAGSGAIGIDGTWQPPDGIFDADLALTAQELRLGIQQLDPILAGETRLSLTAARNETGTRVDNLMLDNPAISARGRVMLRTDDISADLTAGLADLSLVLPALSGSADLWAELSTDAQGDFLVATRLTDGSAEINAEVTATQLKTGYELTGTAQATAPDISSYAPIAGTRLGGALNAGLSGHYLTRTGALSSQIDLQTDRFAFGPPALDPLFSGQGRLTAGLTRTAEGRLVLNALDMQFPNLTATGSAGFMGSAPAQGNLDLWLSDIGLLAPDFSGPVTAIASGQQVGNLWQLSARAAGPAGTNAHLSGQIGAADELALNITGTAPLGLVNPMIAPRRISGEGQFDLRLNGPAALQSLRGPIIIRDARLTLPTLTQAVEALNGAITLANGGAQIDLSGRLAAGGQIDVAGPVSLSAPYQADLTARLVALTLRQPSLYETSATGQVALVGPLQGGATIRGQIEIGQTEIRIPSSLVSALGPLPEVTHLGTTQAVRSTLARADLATAPSRAAAPAGRPYPLDLTISAPSRIFVRGRGLDAELGGTLRLGGTTSDVLPSGRFDLARGRLDILGQRFDLDEGYAQLLGDFSPFLRLVANTDAANGTRVSIIVEGPADAPNVRFESTPELPQDEVLSQLLFGQNLSNISPLQAVQLASAVATLSGRSGGGVLETLRTGLDLDDFDVTSDDQGNAAIRAGKYVSENIYTDIVIGTGTASEVTLNLDVTDDITARGSVASDGETSLGIFFERDY